MSTRDSTDRRRGTEGDGGRHKVEDAEADVILHEHRGKWKHRCDDASASEEQDYESDGKADESGSKVVCVESYELVEVTSVGDRESASEQAGSGATEA